MYKVIIFGTGTSSKLVEGTLSSQCEIICYLDNDSSMWGKKNDVDVLPPLKIKELNYDYVIIASQYNDEIYNQLIGFDVPREKIFQFYKVIDGQHNYVKEALQQFEQSDADYTSIITGISYSNLGFKEEAFREKCIKLAFGSQDLFYDFHLVKYLAENYKEKFSKIKYCIIGLSYYAFQYDMSLSAMKDKVILYYEAINKCHHNYEMKNISDDYFISKKIADKILKRNENGNYIYRFSKYVPFSQVENKKELGTIQAKRDCNKNYPLTVKENKQIFEDYLKLLKANNIKAIVAVFPTTRYYSEKFSSKIENEFKSIIKEFKYKYDFKYIDYFRSDLFDDNDFADVSHLNSRGAEKFTKILNEYIQ